MNDQERVPFFKLVSSLQVILDLFAEHFGISLVLINAQHQELTIPSNLAGFCFGSNAPDVVPHGSLRPPADSLPAGGHPLHAGNSLPAFPGIAGERADTSPAGEVGDGDRGEQCRFCYQEALRKFCAADRGELFFTCHQELTVYICPTNISLNYQPVYLLGRMTHSLLPYCIACIRSITILPLNIVDEKVLVEKQYIKNHKGSVYGITNREYMILHCISKGLSNKEIARNMNISISTVKLHVSHILHKLQADNRTEAVYAALRENLL